MKNLVFLLLFFYSLSCCSQNLNQNLPVMSRYEIQPSQNNNRSNSTTYPSQVNTVSNSANTSDSELFEVDALGVYELGGKIIETTPLTLIVSIEAVGSREFVYCITKTKYRIHHSNSDWVKAERGNFVFEGRRYEFAVPFDLNVYLFNL